MNKNYYEDMKDRESNFAEAITCDAPRTVIAADPAKQKSLANILMVYSIYDLDTGYCQGMNYIVAFLLEFMPEEVSQPYLLPPFLSLSLSLSRSLSLPLFHSPLLTLLLRIPFGCSFD
jgi:hypothetical protein